MSPVDYIFDGLEAALELERELGCRSVDFDRAFLQELMMPGTEPRSTAPLAPTPLPVARIDPNAQAPKASNARLVDLVFLHDRPLSTGGAEILTKIVNGLKEQCSGLSTTLVTAPPIPAGKIAVVLGSHAMRKYLPGLTAEPGQWCRSPDGVPVLITYSPEYFLRFKTIDASVQNIKIKMWLSLKTVVQRLKQQG